MGQDAQFLHDTLGMRTTGGRDRAFCIIVNPFHEPSVKESWISWDSTFEMQLSIKQSHPVQQFRRDDPGTTRIRTKIRTETRLAFHPQQISQLLSVDTLALQPIAQMDELFSYFFQPGFPYFPQFVSGRFTLPKQNGWL